MYSINSDGSEGNKKILMITAMLMYSINSDGSEGKKLIMCCLILLMYSIKHSSKKAGPV